MEQLRLAAGYRAHLVGGGAQVWGGGGSHYCHPLGYSIQRDPKVGTGHYQLHGLSAGALANMWCMQHHMGMR